MSVSHLSVFYPDFMLSCCFFFVIILLGKRELIGLVIYLYDVGKERVDWFSHFFLW